MAVISIIQAASRDAYPALLAGIEAQFGEAECVTIASAFLKAELADFHWQSRREERWLGRYEDDAEEGEELDRVGVVGQLNGVWYTAICVVDGDGAVHWMQQLRLEKNAIDAADAFGQLV